jgi:hypothetical protein
LAGQQFQLGRKSKQESLNWSNTVRKRIEFAHIFGPPPAECTTKGNKKEKYSVHP